jgi:hypothetical protein
MPVEPIDATADRICIVRYRARATTGPSHGARLTWPHGGPPAPTAPHAREAEMAASGCRIRGLRALEELKKRSEGGSWPDLPICRPVATATPLFSCSRLAAGSTHVRLE